MPVKDDTRDQLMTVIADVKHLGKAVEGMRRQLNEVHDMVQSGKGMWWLLMGQAGFMGAVAAVAVKFWPVM